jgi:hypothetical protein
MSDQAFLNSLRIASADYAGILHPVWMAKLRHELRKLYYDFVAVPVQPATAAFRLGAFSP